MAITVTFSLVNQGVNSLRYLMIASAAGTGELGSSGAATPDLLTDTLTGPLKQIANVFTAGLGLIAAGAQTQAKSRAYWLSDNTGANIGTFDVPRAIVKISPRTGTVADWVVDASVGDGTHVTTGVPELLVTAAAAGSAYLDIEVVGAIGR